MNVLIAEDEPVFAAQMQSFLESFAEENSLELHATLFTNGADVINQYRPQWDLLLLDIDMPGQDGLEVAQHVRDLDPGVAIMFVTSLAQYAIRGYEVQALDYILKPVNYYALSMKLKRVIGRLRYQQEKTIVLSHDGIITKVPVSRIRYVEVYGHSLRFHTTENVIQMTGSRTLGGIEQELKAKGFARCHSSFLVNLRYVEQVAGRTLRIGTDTIPISRNRRKEFMQMMMTLAREGV